MTLISALAGARILAQWAEVAMARLEEIKGILADILAGKHIEDTSEPAPECGPVSFPAHLVNDEAAPIEHDPAPPEPADSPTEKANAVQDKGGYPAVSMAAIASAVPPPDYTPVAEPVPPPASEDCAAADDHRARYAACGALSGGKSWAIADTARCCRCAQPGPASPPVRPNVSFSERRAPGGHARVCAGRTEHGDRWPGRAPSLPADTATAVPGTEPAATAATVSEAAAGSVPATEAASLPHWGASAAACVRSCPRSWPGPLGAAAAPLRQCFGGARSALVHPQRGRPADILARMVRRAPCLRRRHSPTTPITHQPSPALCPTAPGCGACVCRSHCPARSWRRLSRTRTTARTALRRWECCAAKLYDASKPGTSSTHSCISLNLSLTL